MSRGRFAPSPTGALHMGNLRTALAAWCSAVSAGGDFLVRFEDLDRITSRRDIAATQLADLEALGVSWSGEPVFQSNRFHLYNAAIEQLAHQGLVYECFCTRKDIAAAAAAPHGGPMRYPGTCRDLKKSERAERARQKQPALRLRSEEATVDFVDAVHGNVSGRADDVVVRRNDGVPAYNIAVVVDDAAQGVSEVVRGDDLVGVTPSQILLQRFLALPTPAYAHIPLVVGDDGERLAKRHGAVTTADLIADGWAIDTIRDKLFTSLGCTGPSDFSWGAVPRGSWLVSRWVPAE